MAKVLMNGFSITNVEPCPKCGATEYANFNDILGMVRICCNKCDYEAGGAVMLKGTANIHEDREFFIAITRDLFNIWNKSVAELQGQKVKRVRIIHDKK